MKICFLTDTVFSLGGVQRVVSVLSNELSKFHEVYIICTDNRNKINRQLYNLDSEVKVEITESLSKKFFIDRIIYGPIKKLNLLIGCLNNRYMNKVLKSVYYPKKIQNKFIELLNSKDFDIIIGVEGHYSILLGIISNRLNAKTIGWQHNSYDSYLNNKYRYFWNRDQLFREYIPKLNNYIVLTNYDKNKFSKIFIKSTVIYNPLSFKSDIKSKCNNKNIIFVGRLEEKQKGLDLLIRAFSLVNKKEKDWVLNIVGDGSDREKLIDHIEKYNLQNNVVLLGKSDDVKKHYIDASIFLSTSRWEGFGLVITEAMECGLPVISFANSGPNEIINKNNINGILVTCENIYELSEAIIDLIKNEEKRIKISQGAIERANDFRADNIVRQWNEVLNNI